mmetsp:Transcript_40263/g.101350  ORF Transcript_40263/g.101350 Transcript_40263/m.101350 type:complete len:369 (+) Transcript_40263:880-1986(+)
MGKGGGRGRIREIIGRHVDGLHRCDGTLLGGGNALLESTHICAERGLVTDSGRDTTEQSGHLRTGLGEAENVVDEEEHILALGIAEVLGHGETGQSDTGTGTWGLVHLTVHQSHLAVGRLLQVDHTTLDHLVIEIVTLTGALTDAGEHGETTVALGNVGNQLHDEHSLADTGTTEQTDLATLGVGGEQIDHLDTGGQNLVTSAKLGELGRAGVNGTTHVGFDRTTLVDRITGHVHDATECGVADRHHDGRLQILHGATAGQTIGAVHSDGAHHTVTKMLGHLQDQLLLGAHNAERVQNLRKMSILETHIDDSTDNLCDLTFRVVARSRSDDLLLWGNGCCGGCLGGSGSCCLVGIRARAQRGATSGAS